MNEETRQLSCQGGPFEGYSEEYKPLAQYATLVGLFHAAFATVLLTAKEKNRELPERFGLGDVVLLSIATHKLARLITKDWVTSPFRAPFVKFDKKAGAGEVEESARGTGMQKAVGDLVTCPWCVGPWVALGLVSSFVFNPPLTRLIGTVFTLNTISDFLHHGYVKTKELSE
ncbi:MAG TPA: DUF1360 domain-containing protein [Chthoniobacterales bacterium]|nr:DUF1360 domain-containing protein [Chthoniobacterales bacterium]